MAHDLHPRRHLLKSAALGLAAGCAAALAGPARAQATRTRLPELTEGPFYPPKRWRSLQTDWDSDLTRVCNGTQTLVAQGEHLGLDLQVLDTAGRAVDGVEFEIWRCDANAFYRHPNVPADPGMDKGFQGFGSAVTRADGTAAFRTIKPVVYPGRTPHIHIKLKHATFGEWTSQLFLAGDPANPHDGIWRRLGSQHQGALEMVLVPAQSDGLRWRVRHSVVVAV